MLKKVKHESNKLSHVVLHILQLLAFTPRWLSAFLFRYRNEYKIRVDSIALAIFLLTQASLSQAQSPIVLHDFNDNVDPVQNTWENWLFRTDIQYVPYGWLRSDAQIYLGSPTDMRPRIFNKRPNNGSVSDARVTTTERAPGTTAGGSFHVFSGDGATSNDAGWWIWYGGQPISEDVAGIDADTDRISMYTKFENIDDYEAVHFATYLSDGGPKEYENSHYYHYLNPPSGTWLHILIDRHPSHLRGSPGQNSPRNNPGLAPYGLEYMPSLLQMYYEIRYNSSSAQPAQYYLDEVYFYSTTDTPEPDQNDDSISSVWVGHWANEDRWEIGFVDESYYYGGQSRDDTTWSTYEVRWSLAPISNENWDQATPIQNTTYNDGLAIGQFRRVSSWATDARTRFEIPNLPENTSQVHFAIKDISTIGEHVGGGANNGDGRNSASPYVHTIDYILAVTEPAPPIVQAGADQTVINGSLVTLDGSTSYDPNDDPLTYLWQQTSGPEVTLSDATAPNPSFTAPVEASLGFQLTVTANGESASDSVNITSETTSPPVAVTGPDRTVINGSLVSLDGSASYHSNGDYLLTYFWEQLSGPDVTLSDANAPNPSFTAPANVTIRFQLTVTTHGESATDTVTIISEEAPPVPAAGLLHAWLFEETSGDTVINSIDSAYDSILAAAPATPMRISGKIGNALSFDGSDDRAEISTSPAFNLSGDSFTLSLWMNLSSQTVYDARLFSKASGTATNDHVLMLSTFYNRSLRFRLKTTTGTLTLIGDWNSFEFNTWHHVTATYDGSALRILIDGNEVGSASVTGDIAQSNDAFAFGNQPLGASDRPLDGALDQIRIYNRALTTEEITALHDEQFPATQTLNFATWLTGYDPSLSENDLLPDADPNQNGIPNLLEYAFDSPSPTSFNINEILPVYSVSEDGLWASIDWRQIKGATDLIYAVEYSDNLSSWNRVNDEIAGINSIETVLDENIDGDGTARLNQTSLEINSENNFFYRLNVKLNNN